MQVRVDSLWNYGNWVVFGIFRNQNLLAWRVKVAVASNSSVASFCGLISAFNRLRVKSFSGSQINPALVMGMPGNSSIICFIYSDIIFWVESTNLFVSGRFLVPTSNKLMMCWTISKKWWMHLWFFSSAFLTVENTVSSVVLTSCDWMWQSFSVCSHRGLVWNET